MPRRQWHELPHAAQAEVESQTGPIFRATSVETGLISDFAAVLETSTGRLFCKGAAPDNPMGWMHGNEARINPYLPPQMPRLHWLVESDGWLLLGFEYVAGRHPDLRPGSPDLPLVAATLSVMATALTPCPDVKVQAATTRWADRVPSEAVEGDTLVHTDVTPYNFLVHDGGMTVVDWSMPCRGAAWIDTALMVIRLVRGGHRPEQAEAWATGIPAWSAAPPEALSAFAAGLASLTRERHQQKPSATHLSQLADAAARWARHRDAAMR